MFLPLERVFVGTSPRALLRTGSVQMIMNANCVVRPKFCGEIKFLNLSIARANTS